MKKVILSVLCSLCFTTSMKALDVVSDLSIAYQTTTIGNGLFVYPNQSGISYYNPWFDMGGESSEGLLYATIPLNDSTALQALDFEGPYGVFFVFDEDGGDYVGLDMGHIATVENNYDGTRYISFSEGELGGIYGYYNVSENCSDVDYIYDHEFCHKCHYCTDGGACLCTKIWIEWKGSLSDWQYNQHYLSYGQFRLILYY